MFAVTISAPSDLGQQIQQFFQSEEVEFKVQDHQTDSVREIQDFCTQIKSGQINRYNIRHECHLSDEYIVSVGGEVGVLCQNDLAHAWSRAEELLFTSGMNAFKLAVFTIFYLEFGDKTVTDIREES
jgi:hypothetical protein